MDTAAASSAGTFQNLAMKVWDRLGALPAGVFAGAFFGALIGGIGGRVVMRLIFLIDRRTEGAQTDFGTIGEFTIGGSFTLLVLSTIAGVIGGAIYIGVRRWLPSSGVARGVFFGLMMMFGPGVIALGEVDLQIAEPAVPIYLMFVALIVSYGVCVALLTDRLRAERAVEPGPRTKLATTLVQALLALGIVTLAMLTTYKVYDKGGSCLSADQNGGCAVRAAD
jgi:hypothetical protein